MCDGGLATEWVESFNTVLDDSRVLCLGNGDRVEVDEAKVKLLFEVDDVGHASPATISRCSVLHVGEGDDMWMAVVRYRGGGTGGGLVVLAGAVWLPDFVQNTCHSTMDGATLQLGH